MDVDQCRATVFLHEPLRRSLATSLGGEEVASMQRCTLERGHRGEHVGVPDAAGRGWFRWDECGIHFGSAGRGHSRPSGPFGSEPEASFTTMSTATSRKSGPAQPAGGRHAADARAFTDEPSTQMPAQALWALTAAVDRLTNVISTTCDRPYPNGRRASATYSTVDER